MTKWNEEGVPNLNLTSVDLKNSKLISKKEREHEFAEELADGGERDEIIESQLEDEKIENDSKKS
ncbi:hypothetical protein ACERII_20130 [Evansella sp. AB-rgal1]|uniref:hypothetical protein n=1 Tax=Evansella sp. AB-rgal1 TaxID=3242696 RepID=UPI00359DCEE9